MIQRRHSQDLDNNLNYHKPRLYHFKGLRKCPILTAAFSGFLALTCSQVNVRVVDMYDRKRSFTCTMHIVLPSGHPERMKGLLNTRSKINKLLEHLVNDCNWNPPNIFLFGFSQGGTVALDTALFSKVRNLGGIISISGYLLEEQSTDSRVDGGYPGYILITQGERDETMNKSIAETKVSI